MELLKLNELTKKKLDETYVVVYANKNEINIKKSDIIEKNDIYTLIGVDIKGIRNLLNIYVDRVNNSHFWLDVFEGLKSRGIKNILFLSVDDNKNIKRTAKIAFPNITFTDSLTSIYPKFYKYISERSSKNIAGKIGGVTRGWAIATEGNQYKYYKIGNPNYDQNPTNYTKKPSADNPTTCWLRSPYYSNTSRFTLVSVEGRCGYDTADWEFSAIPGFCI